MRRLRITVALAAVACVVGALASPSFAAKEKTFFGEFTASIPTGAPITPSTPAVARSKEGELEEFYVGGENHPLFTFECEKLGSQASVTSERSTTFKTELKFKKCTASRRLSNGFIERNLKVKIGPGFEIEFHANGAASVGQEEGNELKITKGTSIAVKIRGGQCGIRIPAQTIPDRGGEELHEAEEAFYSGEREPTTKLKLYPNGFKERLEVEWEIKGMTVEVPTAAGSGCEYEKEPGGKYNPETGAVELPSYFEGELDEIEIPKGELFFETAAEHAEKEV
jgi:hypothetical protein